MTSPTDIINNAIQANLNIVHTALPGIIKSYDPTTNKATVQPALNRNYLSGEMALPVLQNVPVMFPGGSNFNITFPINEGDYVLLLFSERSIDLWKSVGGQVTPKDPRKFDLSDAIAIPGLQPFNGDFSNRNNDDFTINFGGSTISIGPDGGIQIKTASTVAIGTAATELLQVLYDTLDLLTSLTAVPAIPSGGAPAQPLSIAVDAGLLRDQLDTIKGTIT